MTGGGDESGPALSCSSILNNDHIPTLSSTAHISILHAVYYQTWYAVLSTQCAQHLTVFDSLSRPLSFVA